MGQRALLLFAIILSLSGEYIAQALGVNYFSVALSILFFCLFLQESVLIQWVHRQENIAFTRRFYRRFPPSFSLVRFSPHVFAISCVVLLFVFLSFRVDAYTVHAMALCYFILKWVFDPLLGCFAAYEGRLVQPVFAYAVIYVYATTSSLDSSIVDATPIPWSLSVSGALFVMTILQMRMAYYRKFCFQDEVSVERQMNLVLTSLLLMSVPRVAHALELLSEGLR